MIRGLGIGSPSKIGCATIERRKPSPRDGGVFLPRSLAINCKATFIQSLRDKAAGTRKP
jgi:hypothetical protein